MMFVKKRVSKYGAKKCTIAGKTFDSQAEMYRYIFLKNEEKAGKIKNLAQQVKFKLCVNGLLVCSYISDFAYEKNGKQIVEDVKSEFTRKNAVYRLKKKLMKAVHNIEIIEIIS